LIIYTRTRYQHDQQHTESDVLTCKCHVLTLVGQLRRPSQGTCIEAADLAKKAEGGKPGTGGHCIIAGILPLR
jgi:hypothetical protein